ncbi:MAG: flavoprotein, partial [Aggregatilineales bacterium]
RHTDRIFYGIPDVMGQHCERFAGKRVMVIGSGHSAINALLELITLQKDYPQMQIFWVMRGTNLAKVYGGELNDALPARGALGTRIRSAVDSGAVEIVAPFRTREVTADEGTLTVIGETPDGLQLVQVDEIIATTGARPDLDMLRELRLDIDASLESSRALAPMIDPNLHSCGTVRPHGEAELRHMEKDFYIVGMKSYGRAPTFLLATGYEQARSVVAGLVGDWDAARDVQLNLPETGVCSTDFAVEAEGSGAACCGIPAAADATTQVNLINILDTKADTACCGTGAETDCCAVAEIDDCCGTAVAETEDCCGSSAVMPSIDLMAIERK